MSFEIEMPPDLSGGGQYLEEPGTYHVVVESVADGCGPKGNAIDGFSIECRVLAGTVDGQAGKHTTLTFWKPKLTASEESKLMTRKQNAALFIAANQVDPSLLGKPAAVDVEKLSGEQFIVTLNRQMMKDEATDKYTIPGKFLQIHYSSIFHVDDPEAAGFPKDPEALSPVVLDPKKRRPAEWFAFKAKKSAPAARAKETIKDDFDNL